MKHIAVIYHSAQGNTEHFARQVVAGAYSVPDTEVSLMKTEDITRDPDQLIAFDGFSWTGLMAQAGHSSPAQSFATGDERTAEAFGQNLASVLARMAVSEEELV